MFALYLFKFHFAADPDHYQIFFRRKCLLLFQKSGYFLLFVIFLVFLFKGFALGDRFLILLNNFSTIFICGF